MKYTLSTLIQPCMERVKLLTSLLQHQNMDLVRLRWSNTSLHGPEQNNCWLACLLSYLNHYFFKHRHFLITWYKASVLAVTMTQFIIILRTMCYFYLDIYDRYENITNNTNLDDPSLIWNKLLLLENWPLLEVTVNW